MVASLTAGYSNRPKGLERVEGFLEDLMADLIEAEVARLTPALLRPLALHPAQISASSSASPGNPAPASSRSTDSIR